MSTALGEALVLEFGTFGAAFVPLFRTFALFATDIAIDLANEAPAAVRSIVRDRPVCRTPRTTSCTER